MSQFDVVKRSVTADQIYFDVTVTNYQSTTTVPPVFYYNDPRVMPFINCPEDYYLSIIRFTMETGTLPVFIPSIVPNQGNVNLTIYKVTLEAEVVILGIPTTFTQTESIIWQPQDASAPIPIPPNQTQDKLQINENGYYNCYSYTWWTLLITKTLRVCFTNLETQVTTAGGVLPTIYPPVIYWDSTSNGIVLYADVNGYNYDPTIPNLNEIQVFWNAPLFELFPSVPAQYLGYQQDPKTFRIGFLNVGSTNLTTLIPNPITYDASGNPVAYQAITVYQECPTTANLTPITAVVFTSNTLPIQPSQVSTPLVFNDGAQVALGGSNADIANIITDLVSDSGSYRPNLVYVPQAEYRLITLYGNQPLYNLDIQIFYRLKTGKLIPFRIASGQSVTLKIAFIKKPSKVV
jgi:hypothetical protein